MMEAGNSSAQGIRSWFRFSGRMTRRSYWIWTIALTIIHVLSDMLCVFLIPLFFTMSFFLAGFFGFFLIAFQIALFWVALANISKRFHDFDFSFCWALLPIMIVLCLFKGSTPGPNRFGDKP